MLHSWANWRMTRPQLYQSPYCFSCHFHSYGKAAFCLEELMMTNPHNHLYCEQYAEVGTHLDLWAWCLFVTQRDTDMLLMSLGIYEGRRVYTGLSCCLFRCHAAIAWPALSAQLIGCVLCLLTGEVHSGGAGKPGAVQKVFCPSAEAEQQKHEGIVWSLHGKHYLNGSLERWDRKKQKQ